MNLGDLTYKVELRFGGVYVSRAVHRQVVEEARRDPDQGTILASLLIEGLVVHAVAGMKIPLVIKGNSPWVLVTGPGRENVIGKGFRGFIPDDFPLTGKEEDDLESGHRKCLGVAVPAEFIADLCDKPGCEEWAEFHYGIQDHLGTARRRMGKGTGETLHLCRAHALEVAHQNIDLLSAFKSE